MRVGKERQGTGDLMKYDVLIAGGGVAGLTLALKLVKKNIRVLLIEKAKQNPQKVLYKGELLQPKSIKIFSDLGLYSLLEKESYPLHVIHSIEVELQENGFPTPIFESELRYDKLDSFYNQAFMLPHEKLRSILLEELKRYETFHYIWPGTFLNFTEDQNPDARKARIKTKDEELYCQADFYVGAEGRVSKIRDSMKTKVKESDYNHQFLTVSFPRPPSLKDSVIFASKDSFLGLFPLPGGEVRTVLLIQPGQLKKMKEEGIESFYRAYYQSCLK